MDKDFYKQRVILEYKYDKDRVVEDKVFHYNYGNDIPNTYGWETIVETEEWKVNIFVFLFLVWYKGKPLPTTDEMKRLWSAFSNITIFQLASVVVYGGDIVLEQLKARLIGDQVKQNNN